MQTKRNAQLWASNPKQKLSPIAFYACGKFEATMPKRGLSTMHAATRSGPGIDHATDILIDIGDKRFQVKWPRFTVRKRDQHYKITFRIRIPSLTREEAL